MPDEQRRVERVEYAVVEVAVCDGCGESCNLSPRNAAGQPDGWLAVVTPQAIPSVRLDTIFCSYACLYVWAQRKATSAYSDDSGDSARQRLEPERSAARLSSHRK